MDRPVSDELLVAFLHGELDEDRIREIEAALAADASLVAKLEALSAQDDAIRAAFQDIIDAPVPERLTRAVEAPASRSQPVELSEWRQKKRARSAWSWSWPQAAAMAASLAVGVFAGWQTGGGQPGDEGALVVASTAGPSVPEAAAGFLSAARSGTRQQIAALGDFSVAISFRTAEGILCRQFAVEQKGGVTDGVACREGDAWRVHALGLREGSGGEMRTASGDAAPPVIAAVDSLISGEPLDAAGEAAALEKLDTGTQPRP